MNECRVTVLMPLKHFHPYFLKKAVESIINQSCPYWLMIIVVEKSNFDNFRRSLKKELKDSRIQVFINEGRKLAGAINTGMRHAKTDFAAILLADDMWALEAIQALNSYIVKYPDIDFFHSSRVKIDENDNPISPVYYSKEKFSIDDFKISSPVKHLLCWRKDKALAFGGLDESLNNVGPDDYDFPWTMAEKGAAFKAVKECLYYYRDHRECYRLTTHLPLSVHKREIRRIFEKHGVDPLSIKEKIASAEGTYLRQCLYRSPRDKRIKEKQGYDARHGWREKSR
ncbi:MAG: glycosyltransferase [Candidatus Dadabacteria bacterium]|nr:glycosyltransferase [Candidatus Dadabacteria bacterium]